MKRILAAVLGLVIASACTARADSTFQQYVGTYQNAQAGVTYIITNDPSGLRAQIVGQHPLLIFESRPDHFYYKAVQAYIQFVRRGGKVVGLVLTQHSQTLPVPKLGLDEKPLATNLVPEYPPVVTLDSATLASYVGTYQQGGYDLVVVEANGHVFAQITGQSTIEVYPSAKDQFYYKEVDALITFNRDASGKVVSLTLDQYGAKRTWSKTG